MAATKTVTFARRLVALNAAVLAAQAALDAAIAEQQAVEQEALSSGFTGGTAVIDGVRYVVGVGEKLSVSATALDSDLAAFARAHGLKVTPAKPETCSSAALRSAALKGLDVTPVADVTRTAVITVSVDV